MLHNICCNDCKQTGGKEMPPRFKFTKDEITNAALNVTRKEGLSGLTARALAAELGCSVKPIFGLFKNMEEVQQEVIKAADALNQSYLKEDMQKGSNPPYKSVGMAYIRFAKEEKELFKLLFMRDRSREVKEENMENLMPVLQIIQEKTGMSEKDAYTFHIEMWIFVHGMATMIATNYLDFDEEYISKVLTDAYEGIKSRFNLKKNRSECYETVSICDNRI